jgi:hypothetical protein
MSQADDGKMFLLSIGNRVFVEVGCWAVGDEQKVILWIVEKKA